MHKLFILHYFLSFSYLLVKINIINDQMHFIKLQWSLLCLYIYQIKVQLFLFEEYMIISTFGDKSLIVFPVMC